MSVLQDVYDTEFIKSVYQSAVVSYQELKEDKVAYDGSVRIIYHTKDAYKRTAKLLGLMDDFKASVVGFLSNKRFKFNLQSGVPRTGYRGIVTFFCKGRTVYLAPNMNWKGYDLSWS